MIESTPMTVALKMAQQAVIAAEVPIGAVVVHQGQIISQAHNGVLNDKDITAHAEILAIRQAAQILGRPYLTDCDLYVTLEPCAMCAGAISWARLRRLYFGAYDVKGGGVIHGAQVFNHSFHKPEVISGICEQACIQILQNFFQDRRL